MDQTILKKTRWPLVLPDYTIVMVTETLFEDKGNLNHMLNLDFLDGKYIQIDSTNWQGDWNTLKVLAKALNLFHKHRNPSPPYGH